MGADATPTGMTADEAAQRDAGRGFEMVKVLPGSTYQDNSTVLIVPTRGTIHARAAQAHESLMAPMNQKRAKLYATGDEVGKAYDNMICFVLAHPELSKYRYVLTLEDDNLPPPDAHIRLLESIEFGPKFDAVSGIYFTKGDWQMPMAYGDPETFRRTGQLTFEPLDIREALKRGQIVECNGIAMGCALWRLDLFRALPPPWFVTVADVIPGQGPSAMTQDLYFCANARRAGKRFAVDMRVKVGHLDVNSGVVY